ncbi:hypothetical protein JKA74_06620 [Marivirga sp. S37H4]|uniref:Uncharacterized protein n=1 Tax=Marivirga aurantiaca TaxID=2802615 RepID=A0A934WX32_9BACT|nr:hypothetical protein [Marivirga aurantiaca]MBK6264704.1 hypothetical protein [Marivirga aurantiaca]
MNLKLSHLLSIVLLNMLIFTACDEKDPEPKAEVEEQEKNGLILGTVSGQLKNGDPFNEVIELEYGDKTGFETVDLIKSLRISSQSNIADHKNSSYISLELDVFNNIDGKELVELTGFYYRKEQELPENKLLTVNSYYTPQISEFLLPISPENNTYGFLNHGRSNTSRTDEDSGIQYEIYSLSNGAKVELERPTTNYNSELGYHFGSFYKLYNVDGSINPNDESFHKLQIRPNSEHYWQNEFWEEIGETTKELFEIIIVPADEYEITNYEYDEANSTVNFDIFIKINGGRINFNGGSNNSTGNDLTFNLNVTSEVYSEIVYKDN